MELCVHAAQSTRSERGREEIRKHTLRSCVLCLVVPLPLLVLTLEERATMTVMAGCVATKKLARHRGPLRAKHEQ